MPLCRCGICKGRFRVLGHDLLARKTYGLEEILLFCVAIAKNEGSLRRVAAVARRLGVKTPHFTTIHRWIRGLGGRLLDWLRVTTQGTRRPTGDVQFQVPFTAVLEELERRVPGLSDFFGRSAKALRAKIAPERYASVATRDALAALRALREVTLRLHARLQKRRRSALLTFASATTALFHQAALLFLSSPDTG